MDLVYLALSAVLILAAGAMAIGCDRLAKGR